MIGLNVELKTLKVLEENIRKYFMTLLKEDLFATTSKAQSIKESINNWTLSRWNSSVFQKNKLKELQDKPQTQRKYLQSYIW